jgi:hypothetical protein
MIWGRRFSNCRLLLEERNARYDSFEKKLYERIDQLMSCMKELSKQLGVEECQEIKNADNLEHKEEEEE